VCETIRCRAGSYGITVFRTTLTTSARAIIRHAACSAAVLLLAASLASLRAQQNPDDLMPAASAAKAQAILAGTVEALGGPIFLAERTSDCTGRYAKFEHSGALGDFITIHAYKELPDKYRVEYDPKGLIVDLYSGDQGWTLDRGGVSELPADSVTDYREQLQTDIFLILRYRLKDSDLTFRYGGLDVVDVTEVEWVEISDHQDRTIRVAISRQTHLPVRSVVIKRDPETHSPVQLGTYFSNYHPIDGIQTPFAAASYRNDQPTSQLFYESCQLNETLQPDLFTRASLDQHYAATHGKGNKKDKK
jgi:hypothetical protein